MKSGRCCQGKFRKPGPREVRRRTERIGKAAPKTHQNRMDPGSTSHGSVPVYQEAYFFRQTHSNAHPLASTSSNELSQRPSSSPGYPHLSKSSAPFDRRKQPEMGISRCEPADRMFG